MRQRAYRWLIAVLGVWGLLCLPSLLAAVLPMAARSGGVYGDDFANLVASTIGLALLPIAVIGLWNFRLWGFVCLVFGFLLVLATLPNAASLHAICLAATLVRYCLPAQESDSGQES